MEPLVRIRPLRHLPCGPCLHRSGGSSRTKLDSQSPPRAKAQCRRVVFENESVPGVLSAEPQCINISLFVTSEEEHGAIRGKAVPESVDAGDLEWQVNYLFHLPVGHVNPDNH